LTPLVAVARQRHAVWKGPSIGSGRDGEGGQPRLIASWTEADHRVASRSRAQPGSLGRGATS